MGLPTRNMDRDLLIGLVTVHNNAMRTLAAGSSAVHADISAYPSGNAEAPAVTADTVTAADASDLATSITLLNQIKAVYNRHVADVCAHKAADTAVSTADATDLTTAEALANAIKSAHNAHCANTSACYGADSTNTVSTTNATNLATTEALATALKAGINAHILTGPPSYPTILTVVAA